MSAAPAQSEYSKVSWHTQGDSARALYFAIAAIGVEEAYGRIFDHGPKPEYIRQLLTPDEFRILSYIRSNEFGDVEVVMDALGLVSNDNSIAEEINDLERDTMSGVRDVVSQALESEMTFNGGDITAMDHEIRRPGVWEWTFTVRHAPESTSMAGRLTLRVDMNS